jgi:hypothetical protein
MVARGRGVVQDLVGHQHGLGQDCRLYRGVHLELVALAVLAGQASRRRDVGDQHARFSGEDRAAAGPLWGEHRYRLRPPDYGCGAKLW